MCSSDLALYGSIAANHPSVLRMSLVEAEIAKISLNNFIMTKLSFANMLANLCARFPGADVARVTGVLGLDKRIGRQYFRAAMPYGGPCFGRDGPALTALARRLGTRVPLTEATEAVNAGLAADIVTMLQAAALPGARIAILGLAFRHDTDVAALSPTIGIANALHASGRRVRAWDPLAAAPAQIGRAHV